MQNVCLVTKQSFNEGSLDMETFTFASAVRGYHVYQDVWKPSIRERRNETASYLPCEFSQIAWYFLAGRGEIIVSSCAEEWRFHAS